VSPCGFRAAAITLTLAAACFAGGAGVARAQDEDVPAGAATASPLPIPPARTFVTHHRARIGGKLVAYTATAGTLLLLDAKDRPTASVFYVAYVADGFGPSSRRPITFSYNGGPGGSSALVDLGAFGPRTIVTTNADQSPPPPYNIVDNADSILDKTDLVFVDAVGTGFSRLAGKGTAKEYYGVDEDGKAFAQFIRRYISKNDRWNSPKYLAGESYGTTRSAVLAKMLEDGGIAVSGITLMSTVLDFATVSPSNGNDEPYWMYLPTETAVAAYHQKLPNAPADLDGLLKQVRAFAAGPYAHALAEGDALPVAERDRIAAQLHEYTGLPLDYLVRSNLRVQPQRFEKVLLGGENETLGRYDARFRGFDIDPIGADADTDPSSDAVFGAFTAAFNRYVRVELGYETDDEYLFLSFDVNRQWNWNRGHSQPVATDVIGDLASAMTTDRYLHVLSVNGLYDFATPFFATETSLHHLGVAPQLQKNVSFRYYPSGHMIYLNPVAHAALKADLDAFYAATSRS
jgi:carboxypeptidase C (cathepsin A)